MNLMTKSYNLVYQEGMGEFLEKKSKFIAHIYSCRTEEEAISYLETIKKKYYDATHNCFAYLIGENHEIQRCSDDREPSGTAGRPMLDVLLGENIHNVIAIVTRYFGGTLLGTGGLVRAYSKATQEGLKNSIVLERCEGKEYIIIANYNDLGKIQYIIGELKLCTQEIEYTDLVQLKIVIPIELCETFTKKVTEATSARAKIEYIQDIFFCILDNKVVFITD